MQAGTFNLYAEQGWFFQETVRNSFVSFEAFENEQLEGKADQYLDPYDFEIKSNSTPVEVNGNTEYITGFYKDALNIQLPYEVTVWLLAEDYPNEENQPIQENNNSIKENPVTNNPACDE